MQVSSEVKLAVGKTSLYQGASPIIQENGGSLA